MPFQADKRILKQISTEFWIVKIMSLWIEYILFFDLHFLSFVCSALKSEAYSEVFHRNELFTDIQVFDHILWDKLTISSQDCAQHCFTATDCRSMSYNYVTGVCQGFTADFRIETVPGIVDNGWIHYSKYFYTV